MFRSLISQAKNPLQLRALEFCTQTPNRRPRRFNEINNVNIVGTVITNSSVLHTGTKSFAVKVKESPTKYSIHTIRVTTETDIRAGERVNITGKLKSIIRRTNDGKNLPLVIVKADQLCVVKRENGLASSSSDQDVNSVELLSYVCDIMNTGQDSFLLLATNYQYIDRNGQEVSGKHFHRVFAKDKATHTYAQNNLSKGDRVLVHGRISYKAYMFDGEEKNTGFISADKIFKIAHRADPMKHMESNKIVGIR